MKSLKNIVWGFVFLVVGILWGLNALEITNINIFFDGWWTLFIIIPSVVGIFKDENKTGNIIGIFVGVVLLLSCQDLIDFSVFWKLMLPIILIIVGLSFLFKDLFNNKINEKISKLNKNTDKSYCATFGSQNINFDNEKFEGCELTAVFGGVKCDLREAIVKEDTVINISAVFGGVDIYMPKDVKVKVSSTPIFGGVDNKYKNSKEDKIKTIYVNATCIFGGVDIK